jgi:phosphinothricin acetyltransferase
MQPIIRDSRDADVPALTAIYANAVRHGNASFELEPPVEAEFARRRRAVLGAGFPYLVAGHAGCVAGCSYAATYRPRAGYRYAVESSVYVAPDLQGRRIGHALLAALVARCEAAGFRLMVAVIGDSANLPSICLHRAHGFMHAGRIPAIGWKHGRWLDSVLMTRPLGAGAAEPPASDR